jgi:trigger factor
MQVSVEVTSDLGRRLTVQIPASRIEGEVQSRLQNLARNVRMDGFRPGKAPFNVIESRYGAAVRQEVLDELMQSSWQDAITQQGLRPAGVPRFERQPLAPGQDLQFTALFEIYPELGPVNLSGISITRPSAAVTPADVERMLDTLRKQRQTWRTVSEAAREGDRVVVDFSVEVEGGAKRSGKQVPAVLGAKQLMPEIETGLIGVKGGESRNLSARFPADYHDSQVAGHEGRFTLQVHEVAQPVLPELDDAFAEAFGVTSGGMPALRAEVEANMRRELAQTLRARVKEQLMDALLATNPVSVPQALVQQEAARLAGHGDGEACDHEHHDHSAFSPQAERRVKLGMLVASFVKQNALQVDPARVRALVESVAASYEEPDEVIKWYYSDRQKLAELEAAAIEEQMVDWVLERISVTDQPSSFADVMKLGA